jgi:hypothetical protein
MLIALVMSSACPFTAIYVTTMLTEICAAFLLALLALVTTQALRSEASRESIGWWFAAGVLGAVATLFRPDSGMFTAAAGTTLSVTGLRCALLACRGGKAESALKEIKRVVACGLALSIGFAITLAPWTIRNARVFGVFQPIAPINANMPD